MRVLLCVGCNAYEHATALFGAEADATRIYRALISENAGGYDDSVSELKLSPTLGELREAVRQTLFRSTERIDTFTFFFAGHGAVQAGGFYMWLRDTTASAQSMTGFSLSELLRGVAEAGPSQTNIIIDACHSGGLIKDLSGLLAADRMGRPTALALLFLRPRRQINTLTRTAGADMEQQQYWTA